MNQSNIEAAPTARIIKFRLIYLGKIVGYEFLDKTGWHYYTLELDCDVNGKILRNNPGTLPREFFDGEVLADQFTGLFDKNKKEIFENDVIQHPAIFDTKVTETLVQSDLNDVEIWFGDGSGGFSSFTCKYDAEYYNCEFNQKNILIIRNIHENPELMKNK